jgi:hypothetical protein
MLLNELVQVLDTHLNNPAASSARLLVGIGVVAINVGLEAAVVRGWRSDDRARHVDACRDSRDHGLHISWQFHLDRSHVHCYTFGSKCYVVHVHKC